LHVELRVPQIKKGVKRGGGIDGKGGGGKSRFSFLKVGEAIERTGMGENSNWGPKTGNGEFGKRRVTLNNKNRSMSTKRKKIEKKRLR